MEKLAMDIAAIIEKAGFGVGAATGLTLVVRWILTRVVVSMDGLIAAQVAHENRSATEHGRIIELIDGLDNKITNGRSGK